MAFNSRCLCFYVVTLEIVSGNIKTSLWFQNFSEVQAWYSAFFCQLTQVFCWVDHSCKNQFLLSFRDAWN